MTDKETAMPGFSDPTTHPGWLKNTYTLRCRPCREELGRDAEMPRLRLLAANRRVNPFDIWGRLRYVCCVSV